jgi:CelD/BcsL family acetyltransferase involved in cellulose biosynthesis
MNTRAVTVDKLTPEELAVWSEIQLANPTLSSPYFRPEFTQAVAAVRDDVEVGVLEESGRAVGFLPFQRTGWGGGRPVGGRLSDYHAVVAAQDLVIDPRELVRGCGLSSWHFDHLVAGNPAFEPFSWTSDESPYIDISEGFDAYVSQRSSTRGNVRGIVSEYGQKKRKLEREIGPVRFEWHVADRSILDTMIEWKSEQYRRTKMDNIFVFPWVVKLLNKIMEFDSPHIAPVLSVTYVADQIAAINFGMRAGEVLHPWFPAYNVDFGKYSPGTLHWVATLQTAESMGVRRIDLVSGGESYKQRFMSGSIRVLRGAVDLRPSVAAARRAWRRTQEFVRASPIYARVRGPVRVLHNVKSWLELR